MTYVAGIQYTKALEHGMNEPYDGIDIKSDRKSGWNVRHRLMGWGEGQVGVWITAVPDRGLAGRIHDALNQIAENSLKNNVAQVPE